MNNHWRDNKHDIVTLIEGGHMLHGKGEVWAQKYGHYHSGLRRGENTLNAQVCRVVLRVLGDPKAALKPDSDSFLAHYKDFLTRPGSHNDCYAEAFHRQLMANHLLRGIPMAEAAGAENHDTPSIGGFVALPPLLLLAVAKGTGFALEAAQQHLALTHKSARLSANLEVYANALWAVMAGASLKETAATAAAQLGWDLAAVDAAGLSDLEVIHNVFGPACYIGDSLPVVFFLAYRHADRENAFREALLANTNAGGENVHRGSALGALMGAAVGVEGIPDSFLVGLDAHEELQAEIEALAAKLEMAPRDEGGLASKAAPAAEREFGAVLSGLAHGSEAALPLDLDDQRQSDRVRFGLEAPDSDDECPDL